MPERIQLQRTTGWRKPDGAVVVARPTKWGNRFAAGRSHITPYYMDPGWVDLHNPGTIIYPTDEPAWRAEHPPQLIWCESREQAVAWFRATLSREMRTAVRRELAGRDLCCWCPPGQPCHADVLLALANSVEAVDRA